MGALQALKEIESECIVWRRHIHAHPETAFEENATADYVASLLQGWGIDVHRGLAKTGVVGVIEGKRPGAKRIGLRADMDALNIEEQTNAPYRSKVKGKMHACGHDGHTAMLLAAAKHLAATRDFAGTVVLIFQPAEEEGGGGEVMVREGLFEKFPCDAVYGMHNWPYMPEGMFAVSPGPVTASFDEFEIKLQGKGGHAAFPHTTVDPVACMAQIVTAVQAIVSRTVDPADMAVVSITRVDAGTDSYNVIPETVFMAGTIRTVRPETRAAVGEKFRRIVSSVCEAFSVMADMKWISGYPSVVNTAAEADLSRRVAADLVGEDKVVPFVTTMGAEDFAYMLQSRPGAYIALGTGAGPDTPGLHHPAFDFNDNMLSLGASYWVRLVETYLDG